MAPPAAQLAVGSRGKVKIAIICPYALDSFGGVQAQAVQLTERLRARGHEAWLIGPGGERQGKGSSSGTTVRVPINRSMAPVALDPRSGRRALRAISGADVVHVHEPFVPFVSLGVLVEGLPPKVGTFHAAPGWGVAMVYKTAAPLLRRWARRLAVTTAVSPVAGSAVSSLVEKLRIIPNGLDTERYRLPLPRYPERVVFLGRDEPRKGLTALLSAWERVRRQVPSAELVVLGAARSEPAANVRYLGQVDDETKRRELAQAAILCTPNLGYESFGLVLLEGMAAGCAVVASRLPAFGQVAGEAAKLFPPGDIEQLGASLVDLLQEPEQAARLGVQGREKAREFDWDNVLPKYLDAYREAIG
jgi:phosphatidyl-myo-inositol alpha-mannosyltransferase